jgi:hypothetical protein
MQETPNDAISFNDMELAEINEGDCFPGAPAQGTDYAAMGLRNHDYVDLPNTQAEHERARRQGSKG